MKWWIYRTMQNICTKNCRVRNKTYDFRKWFYLKVLKLDVCHFCLQTYSRGGKTYCWDCCEETL